MSAQAFQPGSKPRPSATKVKVREVEDQPCDRRPYREPHSLIHFGATIRCDYCGETWVDLDHALNGALATRRAGGGL